MKRFLCIVATFVFALAAYAGPKDMGYVVVKVKANGKVDVSDAIQKIIDDNPNRTIYFPDGVYLISKPICTPADPHKSVALELSNYAVIKAADGWSHEEAMIRLGGKDPYNDITIPGSNYYLDGGIIDGSGVAKGVSIDDGRETAIRNTSIKGVSLGIHVKYGTNAGSSDADICNVNIVGDFQPDCIGVLVEGYDNTFTNMRIGGVNIGFLIRSEANSLRNIHPLYYRTESGYETSCGFMDERQNNWYDFCYSDEFATAFYNSKNAASQYNNCFAYWYSKRGTKHTVFKAEGKFKSFVSNSRTGLRTSNVVKENKILEVGEDGGDGRFVNLYIDNKEILTDKTYEKHLK